MNVNLSSRSLLDAYNAIISGDPNTDWTIFTYDKGSNDLRVQDSGSGGLEAVQDEFSDGRIQYAFVRVMDPNSELPKFVQINWCGDGVPVVKKGLFHSHSNAVAAFLKASHIQINARNELDVDPERILKRLSDAGGAKYSVHKEPAPSRPDKIAPVGSSYTPIKVDMGALKATPVPKKDFSGSASTNYNSGRNEFANTRSAPPAAAARPPPVVAAPTPAASQTDDDTWGEEPPSVPSARPTPTSAYTPKPAASAPTRAPAPVSASTPTPPAVTSSTKPAAEDRIGPVGTAYTPVSLPTPKKLGNRWGANATPSGGDSDSAKPASGGFAAARAAFGGGGGTSLSSGGAVVGSNVGGGEKKLTWSERQALAKARDKEEEERSMAASAASTAGSVVTAAAETVSAVASSISSTIASTLTGPTSSVSEKQDEDQEEAATLPPSIPSARPVPKLPAQRPPTPDDDDEGFEDPDEPPKSPPRAFSRPALPPVNQPPAFPDDDDFDEEEEKPTLPVRTAVNPPPQPIRPQQPKEEEEEEEVAAPPPMPTSRPTPGIIANQPPSFPSDDEFSDPDEPPAPTPAPIARSMPPPPARVAMPAPPPRVPSPEPEEPIAAPAMPSSSRGGGAGIKARVLFDYEATEDNEIALVEGEVLSNVEKIDEGWWSAENEKGEHGLFPANYVTELEEEETSASDAAAVPPSPPARPASPAHEQEPEVAGKIAVAMYDYDAAEENELSFREGDRIVSIEEASEDWWSGQGPDGAQGLFPAAYVEVQQ